MKNIVANFGKYTGEIKPLNAVNNGPVYKFASDQRVTNIDSWRAANIPYARTHDSSFFATYGEEHTVDVNNIFTDFNRDPYDENSYDFAITDEYLRVIEAGGTKVFYRLGSKIEHWVKKYNTLPPKDFKKWAVICEHIIRHYTKGWANGFNMDIEYWEIWNEPDFSPDDSDNKRTWGGTQKQFFEFYDIVATHLKNCFPNLKIGGPSLAWSTKWAEEFLAQLKAPLDFLSWHIYTSRPECVFELTNTYRSMLDKYGFTKTENILNEWNYVKDWTDDKFIYSIKTIKGLKGSSFAAATILGSQYTPLDMLMYYDARPCSFNGLFSTDIISECLKGYYVMNMFGHLRSLKNSADISADANIYACSAYNEQEAAVMFTYYNDEIMQSDDICIKAENCENVKALIYLLDESNDMALIREEEFKGKNPVINLKAELYSTYLIKYMKM